MPVLGLLLDGGLVCANSFGGQIRFSYDGGQSWSRELPAYSDVYPGVHLVGRDRLFVCARWQGRQGCVYRRTAPKKG